mgnify:CR=1 FL=1
MSKQISTKTTIRNLTAEIKKTFVKKGAFTPVQAAANAAIKSLGVDGNTVNFYTSTDKSGTAAFSVDFPSELFLDQDHLRGQVQVRCCDLPRRYRPQAGRQARHGAGC